jgi:phosphoribosyl 1,2-cyclic phosphate phosphodiesterase
MLVDCGPDLRQQLLSADVNRLAGVIVTHTHGDHCHGLDELRPVAQAIGAPVPLHARARDIAELKQRFGYAFDKSSFYRPIVDAREVAGELAFGDVRVRFVEQPHGGPTSLGMRFEEAGRSLVYSVDYSEMTAEMSKLYEGADVWISDCLTRRPHPTHAHLGGVLADARELGVGHTYLVHMGNGLDYRTLIGELPGGVTPAHDGLEIEI